MNSNHLSILLRKLKKEIQVQEFVAAKISPDRSLVSLQSHNGAILLYELESNVEDGGHFLQEFEVKEAKQHYWTISQERRIFLLTETLSNALQIHQFNISDHKTFLSFNERIRIAINEEVDETSATNKLQHLVRTNDSNTITQYKISLTQLQNKINGFRQLKEKNSSAPLSFSSLKLLNAPYKDTIVLLLDCYLVVILQFDEDSIKIVRDFPLLTKEDEKTILDSCVRYNWIFVLTSDNEVDVWNLNGLYKGTIHITEPQPRFKRLMRLSSSNSEQQFHSLDVSSDLRCLTLACKDFICIVDLDDYFRQNSVSQILQSKQTNVTEYSIQAEVNITSETKNDMGVHEGRESFQWQDVLNNTEDLKTQRKAFRHWYEETENTSVQILTRPWIPLQPIICDYSSTFSQNTNNISNINLSNSTKIHLEQKDTNQRTSSRFRNSSVTYTYGDNKLLPKYALNGFIVKQALQTQTTLTSPSKNSSPPLSSSSSLSINETTSLSTKSQTDTRDNTTISQQKSLVDKISPLFSLLFTPSNQKINWVKINPIKFIVELESSTSEQRNFCFFDRHTGEQTLFQLPASVCLDFPYYSSPPVLYFLSLQGLCVLLFDQTQSQLANGMITFSSPTLADKLYAVNSWDQRTLRLNALKLGLKYRQLDVVSSALNSLSADQQLTGGKLILEFVKENSHVLHHELFWEYLLKMGMIFLSNMIDRMAKEISQLQCENESFMNSEKYRELLAVSDVLRQLREYKVNIKTMATRNFSDGFNKSALTSSWNASKVKVSNIEQETLRSKSGKLRPRVLFPASSQSPEESVVTSPDLQMRTVVSPKTSSPASTTDSQDLKTNNNISNTNPLIIETSLNTLQTSDNNNEEFDERKLDEMDEVTLSFGRFRHSWEKLSDMQIVRDALINSNISMALSFLRWRNRNQINRMESKLIFQTSGTTNCFLPTLGYFKRLSYPIIYQTICQGQIHLARKMILHIGESVNTHFKEIAWYTTRRNVRNTLLNILLEANQLSDDDIELIKFFKQLEEKYPQHDYEFSFQTLLLRSKFYNAIDTDSNQNQQRQFLKHFSGIRYQCLEDIPQDVQREMELSGLPVDDRSIDQTNETGASLISSESSQTSALTTSLNFGQWRLKWIKTWDNITRYRVLIESAVLDGRPLSFLGTSETSFGTKSEEVQSLVTYFVTHNDWRQLLYWVESLSVWGYRVDSSGRLIRSSTRLHQDDTLATTFGLQNIDLQWLVNVLISDVIPCCTTFMKEILYSALSQRGIFVPEEIQAFVNANAIPLLCRVAKSHLLFGNWISNSAESATLPLNELMPYNQISIFHIYFVKYCIDNELPSILATYLDTYHLATSAGEVELLLTELTKQCGPNYATLGEEPNTRWVKLLFLFRIHEDLLETSLLNAKLILKTSKENDKSFTVNSMITSATRDKRYWMALATLAYAPISLRDAMSLPRGNKWFIDRSLLIDFLKKYPILRFAIFPEEEPKLRKIPSNASLLYNQSSLVTETYNLNVFSGKRDINLYALLQKEAFFLDSIFRPKYTTTFQVEELTSESSLSFSSPIFDGDRFVDNIDISYYLVNGQPFHAFQLLYTQKTKDLTSPNEEIGERNNNERTLQPLTPINEENNTQEIFALSIDEMLYISSVVRSTALTHLFDDTVISACICFLELCEISSQDLRVDVEAAKRIYRYRCKTQTISTNQIFEEVIKLFLYFDMDTSGDNKLQSIDSNISNTGTISHFEKTQYKSNENLQHALNLLVESTHNLTEQEHNEYLKNTLLTSGKPKKEIEKSDSQSLVNKARTMAEEEEEETFEFTLLRNKWHLVVLFCKVHNLPLNEIRLIELAKQNNWIGLLYESQMLGFPVQQVLNVVETYFQDQNIKEHLIVCLKQMAHENQTTVFYRDKSLSEQTKQSFHIFPTTNDRQQVSHKIEQQKQKTFDLFKLIKKAQTKPYPGEVLLKYSYKQKRPLLAVIAQCFSDVSPLNCIIVWLYSAFSSNFEQLSLDISIKRENVSKSTMISTIMKSSTNPPSTQQNTQQRSWTDAQTEDVSTFSQSITTPLSIDSLRTLEILILKLCSKKQYLYLQRAFRIYEPSHILIMWFRFLQSLALYQFEEAQRHLQLFVDNLRHPEFPLLFKIGDVDWVERFAIENLIKVVAEFVTTPYELEHFLRVVANSKLHSQFTTYYETFLLLKEAKLTDILFSTTNNTSNTKTVLSRDQTETKIFSFPEPNVIIERLVEKGLFDEARQFAVKKQLPYDPLTVKQAQYWIQKYQTCHLWQVLTERMELWKKLNELFVEQQCHPVVAGEFFYEIAEGMQFHGNSNVQWNLTGEEKIFLLSLALSWFSGHYNEDVNHFPEQKIDTKFTEQKVEIPTVSETSNFNQETNLTWKSASFLHEIESKIVRLSVGFHLATSSSPSSSNLTDVTNNKSVKNTVSLPCNEETFEQMIGQLITKYDNFIEAEKISQEFNYESKELIVCKTVHSLALGTLSVHKIPPLVISILNSKFPESSSNIVYNDEDKTELLQRLCRCTTYAVPYCERISVKYTVARTLSLSFVEVDKRDPYEVLPFLLMEGPSKYPLTKQFITCIQLDPIKVAKTLAQWYCKTILELDRVNTTQFNSQQTASFFTLPISRDNSVRDYNINRELKELPKVSSSMDLSEFEAVDDSKQFSSHHSSYSSLPPVGISSESNVPHLPQSSQTFWTSQQFKDFISLTTCPEEVGRSLVAFFMENVNKISHRMEVELLIRAHFCFNIAHNVQGTTDVLKLIKDRVNEYLKHKEFKLLVRLVVGTKEYTNLQYILDILVKYDCFELILATKKTFTEDSNDLKELQMALYFFLKLRYPQHTHLLKLLFLSFKMYREYADFFLGKAREEVKLISQNWKQNLTAQEVTTLVNIMKTFLDAADYYAKSNCMQMYQVALTEAALIKLQLQSLDTKLLNISEDEVRKMLMYMSQFSNCLTIAKAYKCDTLQHWIEPLYNQVIILGNFEFLDDYLAYYPLTHELFVEMASKFKADPQKTSRQNNFKKFLEYYEDHFERYEMAKELGFTDMTTTLSTTPGIEYLNLLKSNQSRQ